MKHLLIAALLLCAACTHAGQITQAGDLRVERVVMLMRHGVRPPTRPVVTPEGTTTDPWPSWTTPIGHLTEHGYAAIRLLGVYDRAYLAQIGVLRAGGCADAGEVFIHSDTDQRTIRTGDALIEGMFPGCEVANEHLPQNELDVLYSPLDEPGMDNDAARAAIMAEIGNLERVRESRRAAFDALERVMGCCRAPACPDSAATCHLADIPSELIGGTRDGRPKLTGPMDYAPTAAMTLMMEYVDGRPMDEVGWGRVSREDIELIMGLHSMKGEVLQHPAYVGARGAAPLMRRMLAALQGDDAAGSRLTVFVGHDTNISDMSGLLGFDWQVESYPAHTPPPGGAFGFELLRDARGAQFVRAFYRSQTMDQMRNLTPLDLDRPAFRQYVAIPGCSTPQEEFVCPLATFERLVTERLAQD